MSRRIYSIISVLFAVFSFVAGAAQIPATPAGEPVKLGEWHNSIRKAEALAEARGIPIVALWGNTGCSVCRTFVNNIILKPSFNTWMSERQLIMVTGEGYEGVDGELYDWVKRAANWDGVRTFPFIRVYWKNKDGVVVADQRFSGSTYRHSSPQSVITKIESYISGYRDDGAGRAVFGTTPGLEAEAGTGVIPLPLIRELSSEGELTNSVSYVQSLEGGGTTNWSETVIWSSGEERRNLMVPINGHWVGGRITITLSAEESDDIVETIEMVDDVPVSTFNPRYIGEAFEYGEWTMDFVAATNRVAGESGEAYTMVLFTGALWCPYCLGIERDLFDSSEFRDFTRTNNIALVEIDNFRRDTTPPSLLRYAVYNGAANDTRNGNSGAGYLSRHGVAVDEAEALQERNLALQQELRLPGAERIGYPTILLMQKDGRIAGRFNGWNVTTDTSVVPSIRSFDLEVNMLRLHELLALARDPRNAGDERNSYLEWSEDELVLGEGCEGILGASDRQDIYKVEIGSGIKGVFEVSGPRDADMTLEVLDSSGGVVAVQEGSLLAGVAVEYLPASGGEYYLSVGVGGSGVEVSSVDSTLREYRLESSFALVAVEGASEIPVGEMAVGGSFTTSLVVEEGERYRFKLSDGELELGESGLVALGDDLYLASSSTTATVVMSELGAESTFVWQLWRPGSIGFKHVGESVAEAALGKVITLVRSGGSSGGCEVVVRLNAAESSATAGEDFTDIFGEDGLVLEWGDGEGGERSFELPLLPDLFYEGNEIVRLELEVASGLVELDGERSIYTLTIIDDDKPIVGRVEFTEIDTLFANERPIVVVAEEGSQIRLGVSRIEGASKAASIGVVVNPAVGEFGLIEWSNNDMQPVRELVVDLPLLAEVPRDKVEIALVPNGSIPVVARRDKVEVQLIAADAPRFEVESVAIDGHTMVAVDERVAVERSSGGRVSFKRVSGGLPAGVKVGVDPLSSALVLSGVPKRAGEYSAVYQVVERRGNQSVAGGVVRLVFEVSELSESNVWAGGGAFKAEGAVIAPGDGGGVEYQVGVVSLKVTRGGRMSAKYQGVGRAVSFSSRNWDSCDSEGEVGSVMSTRSGHELRLSVAADGGVGAELVDPAYSIPLEVRCEIVPWSRAQPAVEYAGYYTVALMPDAMSGEWAPAGFAYLTLNMSSAAASNGRIKFAGKLGDGSSISGSTTLLPKRGVADEGELSIFNRKRNNTVSVLLDMSANASATYLDNPSSISVCGDVRPFWSFESSVPEGSFRVEFEVCGGYYNSRDTLSDYYNMYEGGGPLFIASEFSEEIESVYGRTQELPGVELEFSETALKVSREALNPTKLKLKLNKRSGVFSGSFVIPFVSDEGRSKNVRARYAGVLLPGWVGDCGCGDIEVDLPELPLGLGYFTFGDRPVVTLGSGQTRTVSVKRSYPVVIEKLPQ